MKIIQCRKTVLIKPEAEDIDSTLVCSVFGNKTKGGWFSIKNETIKDIMRCKNGKKN